MPCPLTITFTFLVALVIQISMPLPLTSLRRAPHYVSSLATLLTIRDTAALTFLPTKYRHVSINETSFPFAEQPYTPCSADFVFLDDCTTNVMAPIVLSHLLSSVGPPGDTAV